MAAIASMLLAIFVRMISEPSQCIHCEEIEHGLHPRRDQTSYVLRTAKRMGQVDVTGSHIRLNPTNVEHEVLQRIYAVHGHLIPVEVFGNVEKRKIRPGAFRMKLRKLFNRDVNRVVPKQHTLFTTVNKILEKFPNELNGVTIQISGQPSQGRNGTVFFGKDANGDEWVFKMVSVTRMNKLEDTLRVELPGVATLESVQTSTCGEYQLLKMRKVVGNSIPEYLKRYMEAHGKECAIEECKRLKEEALKVNKQLYDH